MATQIERLQQRIADLEARNGKDDPFAKLLGQQLAGMELNLHNKNERFLISTGSPENKSPGPSPETETEEDSIRAEAVRRARVRRMAQDASRRFAAMPSDKSDAQPEPTRGSSK